jgi:MFS family permease
VLADFNMADNIDRVVPMMEQMQPGLVVTPEMKAELASAMGIIAPPMYAGVYLLMLFAGYYVAVRILSALKRNVRPREDIRSSLRMNRLAIVILLVGVGLAFTSPPLSVIGSSFAGAVAAGFMLGGYALIHDLVRDKPWRMFALLTLYFVTFFMLPVLAFIICIAGGLANPRRAVAITPARPTQSDT